MVKEICKKSNLVTFIGIVLAVIGISLCYSLKTNYAVILLIFAGICDAFDGTIARKINKGSNEYGVQLDSFADIISSGLMPVCICISMGFISIIDVCIYILFVTCGVIRLTYYNVKSSENNSFVGVPITFATMLIPVVYLITKNEIAFMVSLFALSIGFVSNIKIKKPSTKIRIICSIFGILISIAIFILKYINS